MDGHNTANACGRRRRWWPTAIAAVVVVSALTPVGIASAAPPISGIAHPSAGGDHTCAVTSAGAAVCWGSNAVGQLGDGTTVARSSPHAVSLLTSGVTSVVSGGSHTCALKSGGVWCWGLNDHGEIGTGGTQAVGGVETPVSVQQVTSGIAALALGGEHTCALTTTGAMKCWGRNDSGQLGVSTTVSKFHPADVVGLSSGVAAIAAAGKHTCALTDTGAVKCWGLNDHGEVGDGTRTLRKAPVAVSGLTSGVVAISLGGQHACALTSTGDVKCWGANGAGQIGNGSTADALVPVTVTGLHTPIAKIAAGGRHTCAISSTGGLQCWGSNTSGELGDGTLTQRTTPVAVPGASSAISDISAGSLHSCLVLTSGGTKCWGSNAFGQLGDGTHFDLLGPFLPDPPTHVTASAGNAQAVVKWAAPTSDGGFPLTGYSIASSPARVAVTVTPDHLSTTLKGLANGTSYTFTVRATNSVGVSHTSLPSNKVTPAGLPGAASALAVTPGDSRATVSWHAAASHGAAIIQYRVVVSPGGRSSTVSGNSAHATIAGLKNGSTYTFTVHATNRLGTGPGATITKRIPIPKSGYWMLGANGSVYAFGNSQQLGSVSYPGWATGVSAVAIAVRSDGSGYWIVDSVGAVHPFGTARFFGDRPALNAGERVSTIAGTPSGNGYWLFTNRGRVVPYGGAKFFGDMSALSLNGPVIASTSTPTGLGYFMVASDGGVFTFGDARFHGSTGGIRLNKPVVGLSPTPSNGGYWLVASDGGVFSFGDARFRGSMGGAQLNKAVNGLVPFGAGYLMVASDGGVFNFSDKPFYGSLGSTSPAAPIIRIAAFTH